MTRHTRRFATLLTLTAIAATAALAPSAHAASVKANGQVIAPPAPYKSKLGVPVLLSQSSQKKLRAGSPVVRLLVGKGEKVPVSGKARIAAADVAPGDDVSAKVQRAKKKSAVISLSAKGLSVTKRGGSASNNQLEAAVFELARQYFGTTAALDQKTSALEGRIARLESGSGNSAIEGLQNDVAGLQGTVNGLVGDLNLLEGDLAALEGDLAALEGVVQIICDLAIVGAAC